MAENPSSRTRLQPWMIGVWLTAAAVTLILAFSGWLDSRETQDLPSYRRLEDAAFMAVRAFGLDPDYANLEKVGHDWRLLVARWSGLVVFLSALGVTGWTLLRSSLAGFRAGLLRGHILIVGDHEMARALAVAGLAKGRKVVHLSAGVVEPTPDGRLITLPLKIDADPFAAGHASAAMRIVVAEADLGASVERALSALDYLRRNPAKLDRKHPSPPKVSVHLDDSVTAERLHHAPGGADLFAFSEAQAAARAVMLRHPPFLLARRLGASAAHILIVGFGEAGQAIARDFVLNSRVSDLGPPKITVIDDAAQQKRFLHLHPEFEDACGFAFADDLDNVEWARGGKIPVCAVYVCHPQSGRALAEAVSLRERSTRHDLIQGPIFTLLRSGGPMRPKGGVVGLEPRAIYSFGALTDAAESSMALDDDPDAAAKLVDKQYAEIGGFGPPNWEALSEELRVSNRRVISHIPAKLASLGFDLEPWLATLDEKGHWPPALAPDEPFFRSPAEREAAAVLEHERWIADRRLNGWRASRVRDNARKLHNCMIPFEHLPPNMQAFDFGIVDWLGAYLPRRANGLRRTPNG